MKRIPSTLAFLLLVLGAWAAPAHARTPLAPIVVVDDAHTTLTLSTPPRRIIALAPNVTEILFSLGLGSRVVGVSTASYYPPAALKLPVIYTLNGPILEKILALKPDLLISASLVPQITVNKLRSLHLKVLVTNPHDIAGILHDITLVGDAAGVPGVAAKEVTGLQRRINAVTAAVAPLHSRPTVFYELDKTLYTVGHGSFMDSLITMAGGDNIAAGVNNPYPQLSAEALLADNPQVILLGDAAYGITVASVSARPGWSAISAVEHHRVYPFNDDLASRPGPRIVDGLEQLARLLHPGLVR
ncbi:MAG TPA: cobalamin-binding protein [Chloroflexota bacterium]|nr:cobalamin-binding protein [Chloroflexota bacterium]